MVVVCDGLLFAVGMLYLLFKLFLLVFRKDWSDDLHTTVSLEPIFEKFWLLE